MQLLIMQFSPNVIFLVKITISTLVSYPISQPQIFFFLDFIKLNFLYYDPSLFSTDTHRNRHMNIITPYTHLFRFGATERSLIPCNTFSCTKGKSRGDGKKSVAGVDKVRNPTASQQVIFQQDPVLWGLDMGLFSRQIHSNAARNKMVIPPGDLNSLK
jgi:hypothetical protein